MLGGFGKGLTGDVGVDVYLKDVVVLTDDQAVADAVQVLGISLQITVFALADDENGIVGKGEVGHIHRHGSFLRHGIVLPCLNGISQHGSLHALENQHKAHAASIHHTGLFQHGVLVDGLLQGCLCADNGNVQNGFQGVGLGASLSGRLGRYPGDG